jgi:hypothetical protein
MDNLVHQIIFPVKFHNSLLIPEEKIVCRLLTTAAFLGDNLGVYVTLENLDMILVHCPITQWTSCTAIASQIWILGQSEPTITSSPPSIESLL